MDFNMLDSAFLALQNFADLKKVKLSFCFFNLSLTRQIPKRFKIPFKGKNTLNLTIPSRETKRGGVITSRKEGVIRN